MFPAHPQIIPVEILLHIFELVSKSDPLDLISCYLVCQSWYACADARTFKRHLSSIYLLVDRKTRERCVPRLSEIFTEARKVGVPLHSIPTSATIRLFHLDTYFLQNPSSGTSAFIGLFSSLTSLSTLHFQLDRVCRFESPITLSEFAVSLPHLTTFRIERSKSARTGDWRVLFSQLADHFIPNLSSLTTFHSHLLPTHAFCYSLASLSTFRHLEIGYKDDPTTDLSHIAFALKTWTELRTLRIHTNAAPLFPVVNELAQGSCPHLSGLELRSVSSRHADAAFRGALCRAVAARASTLVFLTLRLAFPRGEEGNLLADLARIELPCLDRLHFAWNGLTGRGVEGLLPWPRLRRANLLSCGGGDLAEEFLRAVVEGHAKRVRVSSELAKTEWIEGVMRDGGFESDIVDRQVEGTSWKRNGRGSQSEVAE